MSMVRKVERPYDTRYLASAWWRTTLCAADKARLRMSNSWVRLWRPPRFTGRRFGMSMPQGRQNGRELTCLRTALELTQVCDDSPSPWALPVCRQHISQDLNEA